MNDDHLHRDPDYPWDACLQSQFFLKIEALAKVTYSVIPAKAGIQNSFKTQDSGSRFACPE